MARKKRRRKSKAKKQHSTKATKPSVTQEPQSASTQPAGAGSKTSAGETQKEPRGMVAGEEVTITSGEIVLAPEKGLDVSFGENSGSGIIVDEGAGEILTESRNEHKVVGEIVLNQASASPSPRHDMSSGGIEISGDGVIVEEEPSAASSRSGSPQKGTPDPDTEDAPTQPVEEPTQPQASSASDGKELGRSGSVTEAVKDRSKQTDASGLDERMATTSPQEDKKSGSGNASAASSPYVLTEEEHEALLRKREQQQKMSARMRHAFPSPFEMAQDLREVMDRKVEPSKFASSNDGEAVRELKLESLRDLVPSKNRPDGDTVTSAPETKAHPQRKRRPSGSIPVDRAFTDAEKAFFEEDLEEEDDTGAIKEIFEQMDAKARAQRGWLDSLRDFIFSGKEPPKSKTRKSRRKRRKPSLGDSDEK